MTQELTNWEPTDEQINQTKKDYVNQCNILEQKENQHDLWKVLTIGRINKMPDLLSNLASSFTNDRIKAYETSNGHHLLQRDEWIYTSRIVKTLSNDNPKRKELLKSALSLYFRRICSEISFKGVEKIKDNIRSYAQYLNEGLEFVKSRSFRKIIENKTLPFQFDLWIIPRNILKMDDDDDDNEYDDDSEEEYNNDEVNEDYDIEARLKYNKLAYTKYKRNGNDSTVFKNILFDELKQNKDIANIQDFPRNKRIIGIVDRRRNVNINENDDEKQENKPQIKINDVEEHKHDEKDEYQQNDDILYMFYPSKGNIIPQDYLSEVFVQTSCEYILGGTNNTSDRLVTAQTGNANMFLLSFHVLQNDEIKVYLYQRGQIARFYPENILNLWPHLFEKNKANQQFIEEQCDIGNKDNFIKNMKVKDAPFDRFRNIGNQTQDIDTINE